MVVVSVEPTVVVPEITGAAVFTGGDPLIVAVCADVAEADPALLVAVTTTCSF